MKNNNFKPWLILTICSGMAASSIGISINSSGIFYTPVSESLGIMRGSFSMHMTIFSLSTAIIALFIPKLMKKFHYKKILYFGVTIGVISTALMGLSKSLPLFYILGAIRGLSTGLFSIVPITMLINGWFNKNNGLATSIALGFSGISGSIFSPIFSFFIERIGWENTYLLKAGFILLLCLPSLLIPFEVTAKEENKLPYGYDESLTQKETIKSNKEFNFISLSFISLFIFGIIVTIISGITQHLPGFAISMGHTTTLGATLLSAGMIGNVVSKLLIGTLSDRIGPIKAVIIMITVNLLGIILILLSKSTFLLIGSSLLFGATYSVGAVGLPLLTKYFFGIENYLKVFPTISFASNFGAALSLSLVGYIYDFSGSYVSSFLLGIIINFTCLILLFIIFTSIKNQNIESIKSEGKKFSL